LRSVPLYTIYPTFSKVIRDYLSASSTSVFIERVFPYDLPDLLVSKRNCLNADTVRKIFCLQTLKFEKHDYNGKKIEVITNVFTEECIK